MTPFIKAGRRRWRIPKVVPHGGVVRACCALVLGALVAGCASLPRLGPASGSDALAPKVSDITDKIQCEIIQALHSAKYDADSPVRDLAIYRHVVSVNLTLLVTNMEEVNPTLSYISDASLSVGLAGQWTRTQDRNFTEAFTMLFDLGDETLEKWSACTARKAGGGLRGDLGIKDIIASGLRYEQGTNDVYKLRVMGLTKDDPPDPLGGSVAPNYGSTIDFTIDYSVNGGPNWTLKHFTGPTSSFLTYHKSVKDTLVLSFARVVSSGTVETEDKNAERAAGKASKQNLTFQILQRLLVVP